MRLRLMVCGLVLGVMTLLPSAFGDSYTYTTTGTFSSSGFTSSTSLFMDTVVTDQIDATLVFSGIALPGVTVPGGVTTSLGSFAFSVLNPGESDVVDVFQLA